MTLSSKVLAITIGLFVTALLFAEVIYLSSRPLIANGSTLQGQEYMATSTAPTTLFGATISADTVIRRGSGSLASVIITGANTGVVNFYDATTSNVNLRTGQVASSTILLASLPASLVAGTYVFDVAYSNGLLINVVSGAVPTSTISYR